MADAPESPQQPPAVDETPISPIRDAGRRNSLEDHLRHRPERSELVGRNILPQSTASPHVVAQMKEASGLEKHMRTDSLNDKLSRRPAPEKLIESGVLQEDPRSADEKYEEAIELEYAKREGGA